MSQFLKNPFDEMTDVLHNNTRIKKIVPITSPACMLNELPLTEKANTTVINARNEISNILNNKDDRILLICGPCSIHNIDSAYEYGEKLYKLSQLVKNNVLIVMRTYFEKPRTTYGWKGLINDPHLDGTYKINQGMMMARKLLINLNTLGLPCGYECLDVITPQYIADAISWAAIGARTTQSQIHRQLSSGLSMPVGFKNGTFGRDESILIAVNAIISARHEHCLLGITQQGLVAIVHTEGNEDTHIILRGTNNGPNYEEKYIKAAREQCLENNVECKIMVDCSHGNSGKNYKNQHKVLENICEQLSNGNNIIMGVMLESNLVEGKQKLDFGTSKQLEYGKSITDCCISFEETEKLVHMLSNAVENRRLHK